MIVQGGKRIMTADELETFIFQAKVQEREACAKMIEAITMGEVLLAGGEMSAQERRTVKALLPWVANRVRSQKKP